MYGQKGTDMGTAATRNRFRRDHEEVLDLASKQSWIPAPPRDDEKSGDAFRGERQDQLPQGLQEDHHGRKFCPRVSLEEKGLL